MNNHWTSHRRPTAQMQDTSWLDVYLSDVPHVIYQVDDPDKTEGAQHATLSNKGNEAMGYLQFIIDYYDRLPASIAFVHGHRFGWHLEDHVPLMRRLRWDTVAVPFANLRFETGPDHHLKFSCEVDKGQHPDVFDCDWVGGHLRPGNYTIRNSQDIYVGNKDEWADSVELEQVWNQTFAAEMGAIPKELHAPCCAEFIVARKRILAHPLAFYVHLRNWIQHTELDRYRSGRVFEYMWHHMFGEPAVIQPVPECELLICEMMTL
ncbi:hypothetical protein WJX73_005073 [Symbiochloris irregularis]|uniref:Uncharacterized protein n=1 Tax=Symbiochloris irregularis TaxID=706552 RepID=A0AAW1PH64_9CHLO